MQAFLLFGIGILGAAGGARAAMICVTPFGPDTAPTTTVVGAGTAASCSEAALTKALARGGVIRFNCGGPATIAITSQKVLRTDVNTTIDGEGLITLDGGGKTRLFYYSSPDFQKTRTQVTLQNLILQNGKSTGTAIPPAPAPCSQGTTTDGGGAAIFLRDGILHIWNSTFRNNTGPALGPDVAGGAVYTLGSLETTIVGSTFESNRAANGGAVGALFGNLSIFDSHFGSNQATGNGANWVANECKVYGGEVGSGGNGGAVYLDGGENYAMTVCGSTFTSNVSGKGALGGALFRVADAAMQTTTIDRSSFSENSADKGGALYFHNASLIVTASTFVKNSALGGGALFADSSTLNFTNDTFANNVAKSGLGGGIFLSGNGGTLQNITFLGNQANGGTGNFGAAIAGNTPLSITNTLFGDNTTNDCGSPMACSTGSSTGLGNLQWPIQHTLCATRDRICTDGTIFRDPKLGALANNGGPTQTIAPLGGSPALGSGLDCPATDQRGVTRPANGCTAGAVEGAMVP